MLAGGIQCILNVVVMSILNMELRKLRHAVVLGRLLNFTKAAEALNLTQSALSRSIQALEDECKIRLFDRNRNMVAITATGREFIRHAEALLRSEAELTDMVSHAARGDGGHIAIGMAPLAARTLLAPLMTEMITRPGFHANVTIGAPKKLLSMLIDESIQICVCTGLDMPTHSPFTGVLLARFPLAFVVRTGHPLTQRGKLSPEDINPFPILRVRSFELEDEEPVFISAMPRKRPAVTVEDYDVLMQITAGSDAVWVTSPVAARERIMDGTLTQVPISWLAEKPRADMIAYYLKRRTMSPIAERVMDRLINLSRELEYS
ncbi:MAG: LysR family transcriptional regulator [Rhizomicrobium sp.]